METEIPNTALDAARVPRSASDLATVTAFARSFDGEPDDRRLTWIQALLDAIRARVPV
jgi:hypothetical protein